MLSTFNCGNLPLHIRLGLGQPDLVLIGSKTFLYGNKLALMMPDFSNCQMSYNIWKTESYVQSYIRERPSQLAINAIGVHTSHCASCQTAPEISTLSSKNTTNIHLIYMTERDSSSLYWMTHIFITFLISLINLPVREKNKMKDHKQTKKKRTDTTCNLQVKPGGCLSSWCVQQLV